MNPLKRAFFEKAIELFESCIKKNNMLIKGIEQDEKDEKEYQARLAQKAEAPKEESAKAEPMRFQTFFKKTGLPSGSQVKLREALKTMLGEGTFAKIFFIKQKAWYVDYEQNKELLDNVIEYYQTRKSL